MRNENPTQEFIGLVLDYDEDTLTATIEQRNKFVPGDAVEIFSPTNSPLKFMIEEIRDENGDLLDAARHPKQIIKTVIPFKVQKYDMIRKIMSETIEN